ncbi:hypothetical protein JQU17_05375 [Ponticoccus sp. SC2-23]|uniref:hypothetical protein n=1 Tax=Alexandriicola marinus TaxID=2081710 RepID=UPI000FD8EFCA|nr:hypothetical protein [Alexandriicola marinus]MBM1219620.1 hypothetical protein [Ponticoccus sp. SC6-9]MBM1223308.1 hypothetical protein [Ponticoccus sp. SC6-15]MBM1229433.1 hypothetical protein [Ponticoccus sp. SC6-38]MBM1232274.1 hypothetical protein [Ponticoccus sp. SC6-45]MBM1237776.1 hypothetical protein [Ponticoccus sp. SC6-49]MBM1241285.1 hypothetical protein [Ponticoccus sp. SC2-64]MBM1245798.1 hypothetical protein [Ponticoccus sp. SC6-42]MBM1250276.1 hypothetical protein [Pontico
MRNAALVLGIIAGIFGMIVGFVGFGWTEVLRAEPEAARFFDVGNPGLVRAASVIGPIAAIAGGAMAKVRALWGGVLLLISTGLMYLAFGFNVATMFPITMAGIGGLLAIAAGKPDEPKAHF